uniref:Uncharacterized protein n=1 Tax=Manihot esculenta TaxID=3983 RepID=A0A2C9UVI9_MANES
MSVKLTHCNGNTHSQTNFLLIFTCPIEESQNSLQCNCTSSSTESNIGEVKKNLYWRIMLRSWRTTEPDCHQHY